IRRAHAVHPIAALQIEYSLVSRTIEADILPAVRELGISVTAYGVFSRGLLTGSFPGAASASPGDIRGHFPRFQGENLQRNQQLATRLREIAQRRKMTVAQLATAWVLSRGADIIPLVGTKRRDQLAEAVAVLDRSLSADDLAAIEQAVPAGSVAGERYAAEGMLSLDSERKTSASTSS
ncbi:MAG TPA: aldo/keto reductase, partial [Candidatus Bathyarchaeia archaeon]|nr:aldo/keto reductase [Candidatus Bathyarchaeia archaeon]